MTNKLFGDSEAKKIKALSEELKREKLRNEALETMIQIAEENFKIKIRKKAGVKQCKSSDKGIQK